MVEFKLHPPSLLKRVAEKRGLYEVTPADICPKGQLGNLLHTYRDLAGDIDIGWGDEGRCQSWRDNPGWWKEFVR